MGDYLVVSIIIRTFVLSVVNSETGCGEQPLELNQRQPAYNIYKHKKFPIVKVEIKHFYLVDLILFFTYHLGD